MFLFVGGAVGLLGATVGASEGTTVGFCTGLGVGGTEGAALGAADGCSVGASLGDGVGFALGVRVGLLLGPGVGSVGDGVGEWEGFFVGCAVVSPTALGRKVGAIVGSTVGTSPLWIVHVLVSVLSHLHWASLSQYMCKSLETASELSNLQTVFLPVHFPTTLLQASL